MKNIYLLILLVLTSSFAFAAIPLTPAQIEATMDAVIVSVQEQNFKADTFNGSANGPNYCRLKKVADTYILEAYAGGSNPTFENYSGQLFQEQVPSGYYQTDQTPQFSFAVGPQQPTALDQRLITFSVTTDKTEKRVIRIQIQIFESKAFNSGTIGNPEFRWTWKHIQGAACSPN